MDMSGKHRAPHESIQIIKTSVVDPKDILREQSRVFARGSIKFPRVKPLKRPPTKSLKSTFKASRPKLL